MTEHDGRLELSAPATPEMLDLVHAVLEQLWAAHDDVSTADRVRFETAVIEILGNIVEHAYQLDASAAGSRRFDVVLAATETELVASFGDDGVPMSIDLSAVAMPDELAESGRGLALALAAVDDLDYAREGGRNLWRLTCTRHT
jgi:serine/threonine-protein kinase RsbW